MIDMSYFSYCGRLGFLMYRVELKAYVEEVVVFAVFMFLMYRVELKGKRTLNHYLYHSLSLVPNVPCGVERRRFLHEFYHGTPFLMHRVELKVPCPVGDLPLF